MRPSHDGRRETSPCRGGGEGKINLGTVVVNGWQTVGSMQTPVGKAASAGTEAQCSAAGIPADSRASEPQTTPIFLARYSSPSPRPLSSPSPSPPTYCQASILGPTGNPSYATLHCSTYPIVLAVPSPTPPRLHLSPASRSCRRRRCSPTAMNPRVEEVSDSDSDPEEMDISNLSSLMTPSQIPSSSAMPSMPSMPQEMLQPQAPGAVSADREKSKHYQCLYPVYFDKSRTRAEGRRVGAELAVENPLAREMADAVASLGLSVVFEPDKLHPKDWSNPGRIRVLIKKDGQMVAPNVQNKHHLYILVSKYLKNHPTHKKSPFRLPIRGVPMPEEMPEPAVPKGWKMNTILPLHSPALTGGGVSENFLQDMMAEMQGDMGAGASAGAVTGGSKKKEKKKK
ncbi:unnamed protein product [Periconia digitata]|uniref:Signal recognition particle protein n=1 Tax=Periconia digitata TaxID=1303443 RepID=A0A9W4UHV3_9PLEO|nr:unnamed protein product [Periconia digitata]